MTVADAGDMRKTLRALAAAAALLGLVPGCTGAPSRPGGQAPPAQEHAGLQDVRPCPGIPAFSCGSLSVRLDPFGPAPGRLSLRVAMSDVASAPRGVLVLLTGGPGEPGVPFVPRLAGRLGGLRGYRLVMFDQRGTGAGALDCPALQRQMGASDLTVPSPAAVRSCAAAIGPDRRFYATADTVADIEALRAALGVARITLDGVSYGSYVAEQFALAHPGGVSRLVLDSVVPSWNVDPLQLVNMRQTATVLRDACAAQGCGSDPASDLAAVVRRYHDGPALLDMLVALSVGDPSFPGVPAALHAAAAGRPDALSALVAQVHAAGLRHGGRAEPGAARQHALRGHAHAVGRPRHPARRPGRGAGPGGRPAHHRPGLAVRPGHGGGQRLHPDLPVLAARPGTGDRGGTTRRTPLGSRPAAGRRPRPIDPAGGRPGPGRAGP